MMNRRSTSKRKSKPQLKPVYAAVLLAFAVESAHANPMDATVVSGQASISSTANTLTVVNTPGTIINWGSFSIGSAEITNFVQQSASSTVLNRVIGNDPSNILGTLQSNGRVFLINPSGIVFGAGSTVNVAGLVASTLNISDADFQAGRYNFTAVPGAQNLSNAGNITAQDSGHIYLIAPNVENSGVITALNGEIYLAAGSSVELVNSNDPNLRVSITAPAGDATNVGQLVASAGNLGLFGTVVKNTGTVSADSATMQGGRIVFRASQRVEAGGTISASGVGGGTIEMLADMQNGTVNVSGTLDASAPVSGNGGFIDTSAAHVQVADTARLSTLAANGVNGTWLIDPTDYTISAVDPLNGSSWMSNTTLSTNLGLGNVTIQTLAAGVAPGDIYVDGVVSWSANQLTLNANNNITINANLNGSGTASLALQYGQGAAAQGNNSGYKLANGVQVNLSAGNNFSTKLGSNGTIVNYTVITSLGNSGSVTGIDLQGINGNLAGNYVLGANIDAAATSGWAGGGFNPLGGISVGYSGKFDGLGHSVNNLTINTGADYAGLFGRIDALGAVANVGLLGGSVTGLANTGGLAGANNGFILNSYVSNVAVSGTTSVGGLVGLNQGGTGGAGVGAGSAAVPGAPGTDATITGSYVTGGSVTGTGQVGGLVGRNQGSAGGAGAWGSSISTGAAGGAGGAATISNSYATGGVVTSGGHNIGGLVGYNAMGANGATGSGGAPGAGGAGGTGLVTNSYVSGGSVSTNVNVSVGVGGLIGANFLGVVALSSASGTTVSGFQSIGGLLGSNAGGISDSHSANNTVSGVSVIGGLVGQNTGSINISYASGGSVTSTAVGVNQGAAGGLVGQSIGGTITNSYVGSETVTGYSRIGGLVGWADGTSSVSNSYVMNSNVTASVLAGGLVGFNAGTVGNSYVDSSNVSLSIAGNTSGGVGGLIGSNGGAVSNSYVSGGTVDGNGAAFLIPGVYWNVGGLVGLNSGSITTSYAANTVKNTNSVTTTPMPYSGLVGYDNNFGVSITSSFWDTQVTGDNGLGVGNATTSQMWNNNVHGLTTAQTMTSGSVSANGFDMVNTWYLIEGNTRPFLQSEWSTTITNSHQLQLMTMNLGASYTLGADIDMAETATGTGMWGTAGFVPVGDNTWNGVSYNYFTGSLDGQNHIVSNLTIFRPTTWQVGLFGNLDATASISNIKLNTFSVTGSRSVGGLAGYNAGTINNAQVLSGSATGSSGTVGGLVGGSGGIITNSFVNSGTVGGLHSIGGLVGDNWGTIEFSYASNSNVSGNWNIGGLVGNNGGVLSDSYVSIGSVTGISATGGLTGSASGTVNNAFYNINGVTINGVSQVTQNGLYNDEINPVTGVGQYTNWFDNGLLTPLDITQYSTTLTNAGLDSYSISSAAGMKDLLGFASNTAYTFSLAGNIDLLSTPGFYIPYLAADFDGGNFTISNLNINQTFSDNIGLFGRIALGSAVGNVWLLNATVTGDWNVGALAGYNEGNIANSNSTGGTVNGATDVGGLAGQNWGTISGSNVSGGSVTGTANVGGLVGLNAGGVGNFGGSGIAGIPGATGGAGSDALISFSYTSGTTVTGSTNVGGLAGKNIRGDGGAGGSGTSLALGGDGGTGGSAIISNSYVSGGSVTGSGNGVGGLVGSNVAIITGVISGGTPPFGGAVGAAGAANISNSYVSMGTVVGGLLNIGGLVGIASGGSIDNSYVDSVNVTGSGNVGGLLGSDGGEGGGTAVISSSHVGNSTVSGTGSNIGGLAGYLGGTITGSSVTNSAISSSGVGFVSLGGLVGHNAGVITNSFVSGGSVSAVSGDSVGGLVGWNTGAINSSYATNGLVTGRKFVGGLVGGNSGYGVGAGISNSYVSFGSVSGGSYVGGLAGNSTTSITGSSVTNSTISASGVGLVSLGGLVGINTGVITNSFVSGGSVSAVSGSSLGGLVGSNYGAITSSYVTGGTVVSGRGSVGGLVGGNLSGGTITSSYVSGGTVSGWSWIGGLVGNSDLGTISNSYVSNTSVSGTSTVGGLVGWNASTNITASFVDGGSVTGVANVGGLVGENIAGNGGNGGAGSLGVPGLLGIAGTDSIIDSSFTNSVVVSGATNVGGLVGLNIAGSGGNGGVGAGSVSVGGVGGTGGAATISNSYVNGGSISGSTLNVGGLVGSNVSGIAGLPAAGTFGGAGGAGGVASVSFSYANNGSLIGVTVGGVVGNNNFGSVGNTYWNTTTVGAGVPFGIGYDVATVAGTNVGASPLTSVQMMAGASFTGFDFGLNWWMSEGNTRPFLQSEYSTTITNAHQLQLMAMNLGANYTLGANIDMAETATGTGMWGSSGFAPVGSWSLGFTGTFDGLGHTVSNLRINRPAQNEVGLFGAIGVGGSLANVSLTNANVTGQFYVGALAGWNEGNIVNSNATGASTVAGISDVGGLVGYNKGSFTVVGVTTPVIYANGNISGSYVSGGSVTGTGVNVGGLVGSNRGGTTLSGGIVAGIVSNSYVDTGTVVSGITRVGGLLGYSYGGSISNSQVDTGTVSGTNNIGGLLGSDGGEGVFGSAYIGNSYVINSTVSGTGSNIGGLAGYLGGTITGSSVTNSAISSSGVGFVSLGGLAGHNAGVITNSFVSGGSVSAVSGDSVGGLVGKNSGAINSSYATSGLVAGQNAVGGLVGGNTGIGVGAGISNSYVSFGSVSGSSYVGGLAGKSTNQITGSIVTNSTISASGVGFVSLGGLVGFNSGVITNSFVSGGSVSAVSGDSVGGLVGYNTGTIDSSYATSGLVTGRSGLGGLVGGNSAYGVGVGISNSYVDSGSVTGTSGVGGLVGINNGTIGNSHYNITGVSINGANRASSYGLYNDVLNINSVGQFSDWLNGGLMTPLDVNNYSNSLISTGINSYSIGDVNGMKSLLGFADNAAYTFGLSANIDLVNHADFYIPYLAASFNGNSHTISNLNIALSNDRMGMFGQIAAGSTVSNLGLVNATVNGASSVGAFAGLNQGTISNSFVSGGIVWGTNNVGGLVGANIGGTGGQGGAGTLSSPGLQGVTGTTASISNSYVSGGFVSGASNVGGLVGLNSVGAIGAPAVTTYGGTGGPGGMAFIATSYASNGSLSGTTNVGGVVGNNSGDVSDTFWNSDAVGALSAAGISSGTLNNVLGYTAAQIMNMANFTGWSIANTGGAGMVWRIYEGYTAPLLTSFLTSLTATANNATATYSATAFSGGNGVSYSVSPTLALFGAVTYGGTSQGAVNANSYTLTASGLYSNQLGYDISYVDGALTIDPKVVSLGGTKIYDGTATFTGGTDLSVITGVGAETLVLAGAASTADKNVGNTDLIDAGTLSLSDGTGLASNYTLTGAGLTGVISITQLALTGAAIAGVTTTYGTAAAAGAVSFGNVIALDNITSSAVIDGQLLSSSGNLNAGSYTQTAGSIGGLDAANYSYTPYTSAANYSVGQLALTGTANDASKTYNGLAFSGGNGVTYTGFVSGENAAVLGGTLVYGGTAQGATNAGSYAITASGQTSGNYSITYVDGSLTVNAAALTVTAADATKTYGNAQTYLGTEFTSAGLVNGETIGSVVLSSAGDAANANVAGSPYAITANSATGGTFNASNYSITYVDGQLSVTPALLMIVADDLNKTFTTADPLLTYTVYGLKVTDTVDSTLSGELVREAGEVAGTYLVDSGTLALNNTNFANSNYTVIFAKGTFTIHAPTVVNEIMNTSVESGVTENDDEKKDSQEPLVLLETQSVSSDPEVQSLPVCQ